MQTTIDEVKKSYPAIVVGSGIGGLLAGCFLAKSGIETLMLEKHDRVGGYFHGGTHRGYYFDYGTQSHEMRGAILPALEALGISERVNSSQCRYRFNTADGLDLNFRGFAAAREEFLRTYPESEKGINEYFDYYQRVVDVAKQANLDGMGGMIRNDMSEFMPNIDSYWRSKPYYDEMMEYDSLLSWRKTREFFGPSRINSLLGHFGYRNQSVFATGIFWHLWEEDYFYTEKGNQDFMNILADAFVEFGGTLLTEVDVKEIVRDGDNVTGVKLANHKIIRADNIICNGDLINTFGNLLKSDERILPLLKRAQETPVSESFVTVYLGTDIPVAELHELLRGNHHTWYFPEKPEKTDPFDISLHGSLPLEISAPVIERPHLAASGSQIVLQTFSNIEWMQKWNVTAVGSRKRDYRRLKEAVGDQLIANAEKLIPNLRKHINFKMVATPLTHERYTRNSNGATAGWTWNPKKTFVKLNEQMITTPFKNLFMAGHWVLYPGGLLTAAVAGKVAADQVRRRYEISV